MRTNPTLNFAPDGMSGTTRDDAPVSGQGNHGSEIENAGDHEEHEFYDDGLVHSHGWAVSSPER